MDALQRVKDAMLEETEKAKKMKGEKEIMDETEKAAGAHLQVLPYLGVPKWDESHSGSAVLKESAVFRAFVVSNELSMLSSTCAVLFHLFVPRMS
ncbi:hypothetical protein CJ030_MR1G028631 [Morella rubra]|uniref:PGG domain-containing protein n=1 Tax=Morella rubra TaxID=262757 RepID=A0A6A1WHT7_9ROSI|nr:hypothetical protein CJ030_MR1G028631 [Morella rubra]